MTLDFRQSLTTPTRLRNSHSPSPAFGGTPRAIGRERTNPRKRTKASRGRGYTLTCIAKKAIKPTQRIGTTGQASPCAGDDRWMSNGSA
jgi:hypothetical protein